MADLDALTHRRGGTATQPIGQIIGRKTG